MRYAEKSIKEIVDILRLNTLFVIMWDILQPSAPKIQLHIFFFKQKKVMLYLKSHLSPHLKDES